MVKLNVNTTVLHKAFLNINIFKFTWINKVWCPLLKLQQHRQPGGLSKASVFPEPKMPHRESLRTTVGLGAAGRHRGTRITPLIYNISRRSLTCSPSVSE